MHKGNTDFERCHKTPDKTECCTWKEESTNIVRPVNALVHIVDEQKNRNLKRNGHQTLGCFITEGAWKAIKSQGQLRLRQAKVAKAIWIFLVAEQGCDYRSLHFNRCTSGQCLAMFSQTQHMPSKYISDCSSLVCWGVSMGDECSWAEDSLRWAPQAGARLLAAGSFSALAWGLRSLSLSQFSQKALNWVQ